MTREDLAQKSQDELIELILTLAEQVAKQQAEIEALRLTLEKNKKPPTNSGNSSQPPSKDQKSNLPLKRKKHKHGPPVGHQKYEREFVAQPDEVKPTVCPGCQTDVSQGEMVLLDVNAAINILKRSTAGSPWKVTPGDSL